MRIIDRLLGLLYPPQCPLCRRARRRPGPPRLCHRCRVSFRPVERPCPWCGEGQPDHGTDTPGLPCRRCVTRRPAFARARGCFTYEGAAAGGPSLREALHRWKYDRDLLLGRALVGEFARRAPGLLEAGEVVASIPADPRRAADRGFDQGSLLARGLAARARLPLAAPLRRLASPSQTRLGRDARARNAATVFVVVDPRRVSGRRVILCDDVLTTGASADVCSRILLDAGATAVEVLALARAGGGEDSAAGGFSPLAAGWVAPRDAPRPLAPSPASRYSLGAPDGSGG